MKPYITFIFVSLIVFVCTVCTTTKHTPKTGCHITLCYMNKFRDLGGTSECDSLLSVYLERSIPWSQDYDAIITGSLSYKVTANKHLKLVSVDLISDNPALIQHLSDVIEKVEISTNSLCDTSMIYSSRIKMDFYHSESKIYKDLFNP